MPRLQRIETAISSLLGSPGETETSLRRAVFERVRVASGEVPDGLAALIEKISDRPWTVSDAHISDAIEAGYSEDQIYELVLAAAAGAGVRRLDAGLRALNDDEAERCG